MKYPSKTFFLLIPILLAFAITLAGTLLHGFSGVDILFHLDIAEQFSTGHFIAGFNIAYQVDHTFYPPLFHMLLAVGFWLGNSVGWAKFLQVIFLPCAVASFMFLVYKLRGFTPAFYGGLLVLGSLAYLDRVVQAQPQALDFVLLPLVFYFCLFGEGKRWVVSSVLMVWNHGLVSISAIGGSLIEQLRRGERRLFVAWAFGSGFILFASFYFLLSGLSGYGGAVDTNQEYWFWHSISFSFEYLGLLIVGFAIAVYYVYRYVKHLELSAVSKLALLTIVSTAVMIPMWADRWLQYCTIPLALLILEQAHVAGPRWQLLLKGSIIMFVAIAILELL
jgi:hypothetical protein